MLVFNESLKERFIRYTTYDTMSDSYNPSVRPSTKGQEVLLLALRKELEELGLETYYGEEKVVMGTLKGNSGKKTIGFMAHVDTASDCEGNGVKARVWSNYDGGKIVLDGGTVLDPETTDSDLLLYRGGEIITSDGNTLLGSDDKAGVAIIMEMLTYFKEHPEVNRPDIEVYFTPDEETGRGMDSFPYDRLKSTCCYTVDGGPEGELETECYNAASVIIRIKGVSIHLGDARGRLVNAITVASRIVSMLPQAESPEATDGRYGYYCPYNFKGSASEAELLVVIRDFDRKKFEERIANTELIAKTAASVYGADVDVTTKISYRNMAEVNRNDPSSTEAVYAAAGKLSIPLHDELIRGGTDGARLAETGVAAPNLFTGGHNLHSRSEWVAVDAMNRSVNLCIGIAAYWSEK